MHGMRDLVRLKKMHLYTKRTVIIIYAFFSTENFMVLFLVQVQLPLWSVVWSAEHTLLAIRFDKFVMLHIFRNCHLNLFSKAISDIDAY